MTESERLLQARHTEENGKVRGAFLAGATAAIAFAFHETADRPLHWNMLPILGAVMAWGASFAFGIWAARHLQSTIKCNIRMLRAERAQDSAAYAEADADFTTYRDKGWHCQEAQMWFLFIGAALYLTGHIWHLATLKPA